ncbi:MAG: pseudouridine synthase [Myxococcota bacterium]
MSRNPAANLRLQKRMAQLGIASRRESERLIAAGRVRVNGTVVTEMGTRVHPDDHIALDGEKVRGPKRTMMVVMNKPRGVLCARRDPQGRRTIYDLLPDDLPFLAHVGRLDFQTEGVLLLTNDGDLTQALLHPDSNVPRTYEAKIRGRLGREALQRIEQGVPLDGRPTRPVIVERVGGKSKHDWLRLTLFEGRNRHVRRIFRSVGHPVSKLRRVAFGNASAEGLRPGEWRPMTHGELDRLRALVGA